MLDNFSTNLGLSVRFAPLVNKLNSDRLNLLLEETQIEDRLIQLSIRFKIAARGRNHASPSLILSCVSLLQRIFNRSKPTSLLADKTIDLSSVLASLARLRTLIKLLSRDDLNRTRSDDEIFKPSNVDINFIAVQIDQAIEKLNITVSINSSEKSRLIAYLNDTKAELAKEVPAWKKVIGALIICATLLSGAADAPQAIDHINQAIKYILSTSIEKVMPNLLPEPPSPPQDAEDVFDT